MSESDGDGSFESADEGESGVSADTVVEVATGREAADIKSDEVSGGVSNISLEDKATGKQDQAAAGNKDTEEKDVERKRATTPTRKAQRIEDKPEEGKAADEEKDEEKKNMFEKLTGATKPKNWGWGGISNWGTSVLSTASTSVHTFADSVGEGLQTVLDSVESSLGAPDPELLAEEQKERERRKLEKKKSSSEASTDSSEASSPVRDQPKSQAETPVVTGSEVTEEASAEVKGDGETPVEGGGAPAEGAQAEGAQAEGGWFGGWGIGGITKSVQQSVTKTMKDTSQAFQQTGKTFMTGSLDVLESIGKKTYDVIAEGDHGLKKTIKKGKDKPNLSQLLREAKEQATEKAKQEEEFVEMRKAHFGAQFDEFQGLVHLEALEMLSNQSEGRVQGLLTSLKGPQQDSVKKELLPLKDIFELKNMDEDEEEDDERDHDFDRLLADYVGRVGLNVTPEKLVQVQEKTRKLLMDCKTELDDGTQKDPKELHQQAIQSLAEFTARSIELFHRVGQLILLEKSAPLSSYKTKATSLASATRVMCTEIGISSSKFTQCLGVVSNSIDNPVSVNPLITNVFLEASNSSTYIQDGFQLLFPVLQQGTIEAHQRSLVDT